MGLPLFKFEDAFIASTCFGLSDDDTNEIVSNALGAARDVLVELARRVDPRIDVSWDEEGLVMDSPASLLDAEYGDMDSAPSPRMRQTVLRAQPEMDRALADALEMS